jgi:DNA-binding NarL/FixJ family response regulator
MEAPRRQEWLIVVVLHDRVGAHRDRSSGAGPRARSLDDGGGAVAAEPARVLIAEDEILTALHLESLLTRLGYVVVGIAADASRAIRAAEQQRPDLVLMDIRLGASDGITAAEEIASRLGIRAVYLTAHNDPATRQRAQVTRPLGWVVKPASDGEIKAALDQAFARLRTP